MSNVRILVETFSSYGPGINVSKVGFGELASILLLFFLEFVETASFGRRFDVSKYQVLHLQRRCKGGETRGRAGIGNVCRPFPVIQAF